MIIPNCRKCSKDEQQVEIISFFLFFKKREEHGISVIRCSKCGRTYVFSLSQYLCLFLFMSLAFFCTLIIPGSGILSIFTKIITCWFFTSLAFYISFNDVPWRELREEKTPTRNYCTGIGFTLVYLLSAITAFSLKFIINR